MLLAMAWHGQMHGVQVGFKGVSMSMKSRRHVFLAIAAGAGLVVAASGALAALDLARLVDVVGVFAGGFASGAALVAAVHAYRRAGEPTRPQR